MIRSRLADDTLAEPLVACGGVDQESLFDFVRVALAAYAVEMETTRALGSKGVTRGALEAAWAALAPDQRDGLLLAASVPGRLDDAGKKSLAAGVVSVLGRLGPLGMLNPFAYRNGAANHQVVFFTKAVATRTAMERLF